jgi:hypothetical protein
MCSNIHSCLAKIKSAFEMGEVRAVRVTCYRMRFGPGAVVGNDAVSLRFQVWDRLSANAWNQYSDRSNKRADFDSFSYADWRKYAMSGPSSV